MSAEQTKPQSARARDGEELAYVRLLAAYGERQFYLRGIEQGRAAGQPVEVLEQAAEQLPEIASLDALKMNRRVVDRLTGQRWFQIQSAREEGASWSQIGDALNMPKKAAQQYYMGLIEDQDRSGGALYDSARAHQAIGPDDN